MVVLGLDPGSLRYGVGILEKEGSRISYIHSEEIHLRQKEFNLRMKTLWLNLNRILQDHPADFAVIEEGFLGKNVRSMAMLEKVRGLSLAALIQHDLEYCSYSPRQVKQALTGNGNAQKEQVSKMLSTLLHLRERKLGEDEGDALAVAYCHLLSSPLKYKT